MSSPRKVLRSRENRARPATLYASKPDVDELSTESMQDPPKRSRTAFVCFSDAKMREVATCVGEENKADVLKLFADQWKALSKQERASWDEVARNDNLRYVREKAAHKGPSAVKQRRTKKHPLAPKRPMSAFLKYSQHRRSLVKKENPDMSNTDVSRLLGEMWRNASDNEKSPYIEQEKGERAVYNRRIAAWRADQARLEAASRTSHHMVHRMNDLAQSSYNAQGVELPNVGSYEEIPLHAYQLPHIEPYNIQYRISNFNAQATAPSSHHDVESIFSRHLNLGESVPVTTRLPPPDFRDENRYPERPPSYSGQNIRYFRYN